MGLSKHSAGTPLSYSEHQQRRDAARARWAVAAGSAAAGALAGAEIGRHRVARAAPRQMADALRLADEAVTHSAEQRRAAINDAIAHRLSAHPGATAAAPVVGNKRNLLVYDYEIAGLTRRMKRARTSDEAKSLKSQIDRLRQLSAHTPVAVARQATDRATGRSNAEAALSTLDAQRDHIIRTHGPLAADLDRLDAMREQVERQIRETTPVNAHVMRAWRGGETSKQIDQRLSRARAELRNRRTALLATLERRTAHLRAVTRARLVDEMEAYLHGRMARAGGRGAAIGAAIGLTAAGIGLLAHHVAHSERDRKTLGKAAKEGPQDSIGKGVAETYRAWIDRLLGKSTAPIRVGDDIARAYAPGITQAFAEGATQPPIEGPDGQKFVIDTDFDVLNPAVRRHMADYALDRIVDISQQQRDAIRDVLMQQSVLQGIGPRDVARSVREHIGLTPHQFSIVQGYRAELEALDPAALERKLRDARYDRTVRRAIETGTPLSPEQIDKMVDAYQRRMLALRAETIARTESIRATSYGALARAQDVLDAHPDLDVIKRWIATEDERTRPTHRDLDGQEVQGIETPFKTSEGHFIRWPIDTDAPADECINCRCAIGYRFIPKAASAPSRQMAMAV